MKDRNIRIVRVYPAKELLAELKELAIREHDNDCDQYYMSTGINTCDCGADEHNAKVEDIYKKVVGE